MSIDKNTNQSKRKLLIDFELYADNDPDFKRELVKLMAENLEELRDAQSLSVSGHDPLLFSKSYHKMKTTLVMLEDEEFDTVIQHLKSGSFDSHTVSEFHRIVAEIISSLATENNS